MSGTIYLDHSDLGLPDDSDAYHDLAEELGGPPPWCVSALKALFDRRYPGWDDIPQLSVSSPVSRLRSLTSTVGSGADAQATGEALRELSSEVKYAQIRVMCPRGDGYHAH